jgi:methionyl-tRNA formyltransferase
MLKITQTGISTENTGQFTPGQVINVSRNGIHVACSDNMLLIKEVQPQAGKVMPAVSFAAGYKITQGSLLT